MTQRALRRLSKIQQETAIQLHLQGLPNAEIAERLNCTVNQVSGTINTAVNRGIILASPSDSRAGSERPARKPRVMQPAPVAILSPVTVPSGEPIAAAPPAPAEPPQVPPPPVAEGPPMTTPSAASAPASLPVGATDPAAPWFGFNVTQLGRVGGLLAQSQQAQFQVERIIPNEGLVGHHFGSYSPEILGQTYGKGLYRVRIIQNGQVGIAEQQISDAYGETRYPHQANADDGRVVRHDRDRMDRRPGPWGYPQDWASRQDPYRERPAPAVVAHENAATEAIKQMGQLQQQVLASHQEARKAGPESFFQNFLREQHEGWKREREERESREEARRREIQEERRQERVEREAREKSEREAREAQYKADLEAREAEHRRQMERQKDEAEQRRKDEQANREFLLAAEKQRLESLRVEMEAKEKILKAELTSRKEEWERELARTREDMKSLERSVTKDLEARTKDLDRQHEERLKALEREQKLREERLAVEGKLVGEKLASEQKLMHEKLELERQMATAQTTAGLIDGMKGILREVKGGMDAVLEHRKIEMGYRPHPANVTNIPEAPAGGGRKAAEGAPAREEEGSDEAKMDKLIGEMLRSPSARSIVTEWARQVASGVPPGVFVGFFMDSYQSIDDHQLRGGCRKLTMFMRTRKWDEVYPVLAPHLTDEERQAFTNDWAETFYEGFRSCVFAEIDGFWAQAAREAAAREAPAQPDGEAAATSEGAEAAKTGA